MPREKIGEDTEGRYLEISWRNPSDDDSGNPGWVQISTHDERADSTVAALIQGATEVMDRLAGFAADGDILPNASELVQAWKDRVDEHQPELTGNYIDLSTKTLRHTVRTLHRARNQALPSDVAELASQLPELPRAGSDAATAGDLPPLPIGRVGWPGFAITQPDKGE